MDKAKIKFKSLSKDTRLKIMKLISGKTVSNNLNKIWEILEGTETEEEILDKLKDIKIIPIEVK